MRWVGALYLGLHVAGCARRIPDPDLAAGPLDAVLVPGCPTRTDGTLSRCLWARTLQAHRLWEDGLTRRFVVSGNAAANPYLEAEALEAGLVALGVPRDAIVRETQALHSDENAAYTLAICEEHGWSRLGIVSHDGHAKGIRAMVRGWGHPAVAFGLDVPALEARLAGPLPDVRVEPVPAHQWLPLSDREDEIARRTGRGRRPHSLWVYTAGAVRGAFGRVSPPPPPVREPTLDGRRHRVDTAPW